MTDRPARRTDARSRLLVAALAVALLGGLAATVSAASVPACRVDDIITTHHETEDWQRTLLDPTYRLPAEYEPGRLRSTYKAGLNGGYRVRAFMIPDLRAMASAARRSGARLAVQSAYRSYSTQVATFAYWSRLGGYRRALLASARAGHSEHQLGTTIDFRSYSGAAPWDYTDWGKTASGKWLRRNAWKYGFVLSYPMGATSVTCYTYEPWHFRYVGREAAREIREQGLTLREWLWAAQVLPEPTPTPTPNPTEEPTPTPTATPSDELTPTPTPTPTEDPTPTPTQEPG